METIVVDSSVWVHYFGPTSNSETEWLELAIGRDLIAMTDMIPGRSAARYSRRTAIWRDQITVAGIHDFFNWQPRYDMAVATAENHRSLRSKGFTVRKTIDCWIATFCIQNQYPLLHRDRDFEPFERELGLRVIHP